MTVCITVYLCNNTNNTSATVVHQHRALRRKSQSCEQYSQNLENQSKDEALKEGRFTCWLQHVNDTKHPYCISLHLFMTNLNIICIYLH